MTAVSPLAVAQALAQTVITPTGETATSLHPGGGGTSTTIETGTIKAGTAFNKFSAFTVDPNFTVNMVVPTQADRLVNIVGGAPVSIRGIVSGYKGMVTDATRGGDIYFVAPRGFIVGAEGVVNVGSLTVVTPTDAVADRLMTNPLTLASVISAGAIDLSSSGITIDGHINAIDAIRLRSASVTLGSGSIANAGVAALEAVDKASAKIFEAVVNADNLRVAGEIVYQGGKIEIVGTNSVTIAGTVTTTADRASAKAAGSIAINSAGTIEVASGGSLISDRVGGAGAGDVTLNADASSEIDSGETSATTLVTLGGTVKGGNVTASVKASAVTSYKNDTLAFKTQAWTVGALAGLNGGYESSTASATVKVLGTAQLTATDDLRLGAEAIATAEMPVVVLALLSGSPVQLAAVAGIINSTASVDITGAAQLTAGGKLTVAATNTSKVDVSSSTRNGSTVAEAGAAAVTYGAATTHTQSTVGADVVVDAAIVSVSARNEHSFSATAASSASKDGYAGVGLAYSDQTLTTKASFDASLQKTTGSVVGKATSLTVEALTNTIVNKTAGATTVGSTLIGKTFVDPVLGAPAAIAGKLGGISQVTDAQGGGNSHPRVGGGVSVAFDNQSTSATIGAADKTIKTSGDVVVAARTNDAGLRNIAQSTIASNDDATKDNGATSVGVSAAVAYAEHNHTTLAEVKPGTVIDAARLAIGAETIVPITSDWTRFDSVANVLKHLNGTLGVGNTVASSFTAASSAAENLGVSGSVNLNILTSDTRAWLGEDTKVTVGAKSATAFGDTIGLDWSEVQDKALSITALSRLESLIIGGQFSLTLGANSGNGQQGTATSVGGSYTGPVHKAVTVAGVGAGAVIDAVGGLAVKAQSDDQLIAIAPSSGKGSGVGAAGLVNYVSIDNTTRAVVSNLAKIDAASVALAAGQDFLVVNLAMPLPVKAEGSAVGVGIAINDIAADTLAGVVDTSAITRNAAPVLAVGWSPYVNTSSLDVTAANGGYITAFGVAGATVDDEPNRQKTGDKIKKKASESKLLQAILPSLGDSGKVQAKIQDLLKQGPVASPDNTDPAVTLGAAGSAAVNIQELKAQALVNAAKLDRYAATGKLDAALSATNTPITVAGAGAGGKVSTEGSTSVAIAGAAAIDISNNNAVAALHNTTADNSGDINITALNGGVHVAVGLGVALNVPKDEEKAGDAAAAVSASVIVNKDTAHAAIDDSVITGVAGGTDRSVSVTAYNAPKMGAGGGAGYQGGKFGLGAAVTVIVLGDKDVVATEAVIRDSTITLVDNVKVNAADPSVVLALAASGGKGATEVGIAGAGAIISSNRTTRAGIGAIDGSSTIDATGDVKVTATASRTNALDDIAVGRSGNIATDSGYDFSGGSTIGDLRAQDDTKLSLATGTAGLMIVAGGTGQVSGTGTQDAKANVGASFGAIITADKHEAFVDNATVKANRLEVKAIDDAVRVGLAVGIATGATYGFTGSIVVAEDNGTVKASVGSATGNRTQVKTPDLDIGAEDKSITAALAGSFTKAGTVAVGASLASVGANKAVSAELSRSDVAASGTVAVKTKLSGSVFDLAFSGAVTQGQVAIAGAATFNDVTASARAKIDDSSINPLLGSRAALTVSGEDSQFVLAGALGFVRGETGAGGVALVVNRRGGDADGVRTSAEVSGGLIDANSVLVSAKATSDIKSLALGVAIGRKFVGGGSIVTNVVDGDVKAMVSDGARIVAQNNAAVIARSEDELDVIGGGVGFSVEGGGLGISIVTNVMNADTIAAIEGFTTRVSALGLDGIGTEIIADGSDNMARLVSGVAINASSFNTSNIGAISIGAGKEAGIGGNVATTVVGGATEARVIGARVNSASGAASGQQTDIAASDQTTVNSLVGAVGASQGAGVAGGFDVAVLGRDVRAYGSGASLQAAGAMRIAATSSQDTTGINLGIGAGKAGIAGAITVTQMKAKTEAYVDGGSATAGSLAVKAYNRTDASVNTGTAGVGSTVGAGVGVTVITSDNQTLAAIGISSVDDVSLTSTTVKAGITIIDAVHSADLNLLSVGAGIGGQVGVAAMGSVLLTADQTRAGLYGSSLRSVSGDTATSLAITATEAVTAHLRTGAVGVGVVGIGGAVGVVVSQNTVAAGLERADTNATTQSIAATGGRDINAITAALGAGKVGIAGSIGVLKVGTAGLDANAAGVGGLLGVIDGLQGSQNGNADGNAVLTQGEIDQIQTSSTVNAANRTTGTPTAHGTLARVIGSTVTGALTVTSTDTTHTEQQAGAIAGGGVGAGAGIALTDIGNTVAASVDAASTVTGPSLAVNAAANGLAVDSKGFVGAAGAVGIGAGIAIGNVNNVVSASAGGTLTGFGNAASLTVAARDDSRLSNQVINAVAGGAAIGGTVSMSRKGGTVDATTGGAGTTILSGYQSVSLNAAATGRVFAEGIGAIGGAGIAVQGAYVEAKDSIGVTATLGSGSYGRTPLGIKVDAVRTPEAYAHVIGVSVSGFVALGASVAHAIVAGDVTAKTDGSVKLTNAAVTENNVTRQLGSNLSITARMTTGPADTAKAEAQSGTGGGLIGADASIAIANNTSNIRASTGAGLKMGFGDLSILANRQSSQNASTLGISAGLLAVGATYAGTEANGEISASMAGDLRAPDLLRPDDSEAILNSLSISATGKDVLNTKSQAGSGGLVAGNAAIADNKHHTGVIAQILDGSSKRRITAQSLTILTNYEADSAAIADSTLASALGGSGADARRTIDTTVTTRIGENALIDTFGATLSAYQSTIVAGGGANAASGGLFNGAAGLSTTTITPTAKVAIGHAAEVNVMGIPSDQAGKLVIQAANTVSARDTATLNVGSGIPIAEAKVEIDSTTSNLIDIGADTVLTSVGQIIIGAYSLNSVTTNARISTYGGVGSAGGDSNALVTANHIVTIGSNSHILGGDRIEIAAGRSGNGINANLNANAINDTFNYTALAVNTRPDVKARTTNTSTLSIAAGAKVEGIRDVNLSAYEGKRSAVSDGTGHNPLLEAFSSTIDRSNSDSSGTGVLQIDGSVAAGIRAKQTVAIAADADGTVTRGPTSAGIVVNRQVYAVRSSLQAKVDALDGIDRTKLNETQIASLDGELSVFRLLLAEAPPEPLTLAQRTSLEGRRTTLAADRARVQANAPFVYGTDGATRTLNPDELGDRLTQIDNETKGINTQLLATSFPTTYGYTIGDIYAAPGDVNIEATSLSGAGTVKAEGGATISVLNARPDYLIVNRLYIPQGDTAGGHVRLSGGAAAGQGSPAIFEIDKDALPGISIQNTAISGKAGIFLQGQIDNLGGAIEVVNQTGGIAQFAPIAGRSLSISAPNGPYVVNLPNGIFTVGAAPEAAWFSYALLPVDATEGAFTVANFLYNRNPDGSPKFTDAEHFTFSLLETARTRCGPRCLAPIIFYDTINQKNSAGAGQYAWANAGGAYFGVSKVGIVDLTTTAPFAGPSGLPPALAPRDGIKAQVLIVNARDINIAAPARIGRNNNYSLNIDSMLDSDIAAIRAAAARRGVTLSGTIDFTTLADNYGKLDLFDDFNAYLGRTLIANVGARAIGARLGAEQIAVAYDFDNDRLVTPDIDGAGGGSIKLTGRIFSTTTYGSLQVNNGFGDIQINNDSAATLKLGSIDTGRGSLGKIQITDTAKNGFGAKKLTTWYIYENTNDTLSVYDNKSNGADDYTPAMLTRSNTGTEESYDPAAGYRYQWDLTRSANRFVLPNTGSSEFAVYNVSTSDWVWNESGWATSGQQFVFDGRTNAPIFEKQASGTVTQYDKTATGYGNFGFYTTDNFSWGEGRFDLKINIVTGITVKNTLSVKADNRIAINFSGNRTANVNIASRGFVSLDGAIFNPTGTTVISAIDGAGGIRVNGGTIETSNLSLSGRAIASALNPLSVVMDGSLSAIATAGSINLAILGKAHILGVSATGDVKLSATEGLIGSTTNSYIAGRNIDLAASAGAITGIGGSALTVQTNETVLFGNRIGGELSAIARDDINLRQPDGTIRLKQIASGFGNVSIEATNGSLTNAIAEFTIDTENQLRLASVWSDLGLTDPASVLKAVTSFETNVKTQQSERVRLLNQTTIVNGRIVGIGQDGLSTEENIMAQAIYVAQAKAALGTISAPTDAQVLAYVQARYDAIESFATDFFGVSRPAGFDSNDRTQVFAYTLDATSDRYKEITRGVWSESQLAQTISGTALTPISNTQTLQQAANIRGKTVTLSAANGAIGQNLAPIEIIARPGAVLSVGERAALAAAGPGDISVVPLAGGGSKLVISQQRLINLTASGAVTAVAAGDLYLGSASDIAIADVTTSGTARINVAGAVTNAAASDIAAITARDLSIEASGGSIGTANTVLAVQLSHQLTSARAGGDVRIVQLYGDLAVGVGFANNLFSLAAPEGSIVSAFANSEEVRLQGGSIQLTAEGDLGTNQHRLQVQIAGNGLLTGSASAAVIYSPFALLTVGDMSVIRYPVGKAPIGSADISGRDVKFAGEFIAVDLTSRAPTGTVSLSGGLTLDRLAWSAKTIELLSGAVIDNTGINAGALTLVAGSGGLTIGRGGSATIRSGGDVDLFSDNDLLINGTVNARNFRIAAADGLTLATGSRLLASGYLSLDGAVIDIGAGSLLDAARIVLQGGPVTFSDSVRLASADTLVVAGSTLNFGNDVMLTAASGLRVAALLGGISVGERALFDGQNVTLMSLGALALGSSARLQASGNLTLTAFEQLGIGSASVLTAGENLFLTGGALQVGDDTKFVAAIDLTAESIDGDVILGHRVRLTGGGLTVASQRGLAFGDDAALLSNGPLKLTARGTLAIGNEVSFSSQANSATLAAGRIVAANNTAIHASGDLAILSVSSVEFGDGAKLQSDTGLAVVAGDNLVFGKDAVMASGGMIALTAVGNAAFGDSAALSGARKMTVQATGAIMFGAGGRLESASEGLTVTAAALRLGKDLIGTAARQLVFRATAGGIDIGSQAKLSADAILLDASGDLALGDRVTVVAGGNEALVAGAKLSFGTAAILVAEQGSLTIDAGIFSARDHANFSARDAFMITSRSGSTTFGGDATLTSARAAFVSAADLVFGDRLDIDGDDSVTLNAAGLLTMGDDAILHSSQGGIAWSAASLVVGDRAGLSAFAPLSISTNKGSARFGRGAILAGAIISIDVHDQLAFGNGSTAKTPGVFVIDAAGVAFGDNAALTAGSLDLHAHTGNSTFGASGLVDVVGSAVLDTAKLFFAGPRFDLRAGDKAIVAAAEILIGSVARVAAKTGEIRILTRSGTFSVGDGAVINGGADVSLTAVGAFDFGAGAKITSAKTLTLLASERFTSGPRGLFEAGAALNSAAADIAIGEGSVLRAAAALSLRATSKDLIVTASDLRGATVDLAASGAAALRGSRLNSDGRTTIAAGTDLRFESDAIVAERALLSAGRNLTMVAGTLGTAESATLRAGAELLLGDRAEIAGSSIELAAGSIALAPAILRARRAITLRADAAIVAAAGTELVSGSTIDINSGRLDFLDGSRINASGALSIRTVGDQRNDAAITAAKVTLDAGGLLDVASATATGQIALKSGGELRLGRVETADTAAAAVAIISGKAVTGRVASPLHVSARYGGLTLVAQDDIGNPLRIDVRKLFATSITGNVDLQSSGPLMVSGAAAGHFHLVADGALTATALNAATIDLRVKGPLRYTGGTFTDGVLVSDTSITASALTIGNSLNLQGPVLDLQADNSSSLHLNVSGFDGAMARTATLRLAAPIAITFNRLNVDRGTLSAATPSLEVVNGVIGTRLDIAVPKLTAVLTRARIKAEPVTLQGRAATGNYSFKVTGRRFVTNVPIMGGQASRGDDGFTDPAMMVIDLSGGIPTGGLTAVGATVRNAASFLSVQAIPSGSALVNAPGDAASDEVQIAAAPIR